jgi:glycosyltransferase involved in cell wall biosynthesis
MKIAIVGSRGYPYVYSGYETLIAELAPRLRDKGHQVRVYCHRELFKEKPAMVDGIKLSYIPGVPSKILSQFTHSLLSTLHVIFDRPDVVLYVNSANGPFGLFTRIGGVPSAINVDGLEWKRPKWRGLGSRYFRFASYLATRLFDKVVTDSQRMAEIYRAEFGSDSSVVAYGADIGYAVNSAVVAEFGVTPGNYFLVVGRMIPDNNVDLIVRGFSRTKLAKKLVVLGGVPYKDPYARMVVSNKDERVVFPGYVRDKAVLKELYCNCFAYVHGHEFGGTNPALLKALGYGCCILALDTVFNREVLEEGKYGLFFQKNIGSMQHLLEDVSDDQQKVGALKAIARERIVHAYSWERIADQYEQLFHALVQKK